MDESNLRSPFRPTTWTIVAVGMGVLAAGAVAFFALAPSRELPSSAPLTFPPPADLFVEKRPGRLPGDLAGPWPRVFSPDGATVAYATYKKGGMPGTYIVHGERRSEEFEGLESDLHLSRDGKTLTYVARKNGLSHVVQGDALGEGFHQIEDFTLSPDGTTTALTVRKPDGRRALRVGNQELRSPYDETTTPTFGPDGKTLAYVGWTVIHRDSTFLRGAVNKSTCRLVVGTWVGPVVDEISRPVIFSPDGKRVAYVCRKGQDSFVMVNGDRGDHFMSVRQLRFTPDGRVAYVGADRDVNYIVVGNRKSRALGQVTGALEFSSDGKTLAYAASDGGSAFVVVGDRKGETFSVVCDPFLSPDGKTVAYWGSRDGKNYPVIGDRIGPDHYGPWDMVEHVRFAVSPDGRTVAYKAQGHGSYLIAGERRFPEFVVTTPVFNADGTKVAFGTLQANEFRWRVIDGPFAAPADAPNDPDTLAREPALVGYWKLDESAGRAVLDASGRKNHGMYMNGPVIVEDKPPLRFADRSARAFVKGGEQRIQIPDSPSLGLDGSLTLSLWIKPDTEGGEQGLLEKCNQNAVRKFAGVSLSLQRNGSVDFQLHHPQASRSCTTGVHAVAVGAWTHVAAVYDQGAQTAQVFLNGKLAAIQKSVAPPGGCPDPLLIGSDLRLNHFEGAIDDVRVYERPLSEEDVRALASGEERPRKSNR